MRYPCWIKKIMKQINTVCEDQSLISRVSLVLNSFEIDTIPWQPTVEYLDDCVDVIWCHLHPSIMLHISHTSYNSHIMCWDDNKYQSRTVELNINNARNELCTKLDQILCRFNKP